MADITVKKADGTTDVTYSKVNGAAGDQSPAVWEVTAASAVPAFRPRLVVKSRNYAGQTPGRRLEAELLWPVTVTGTDGVTRLVDTLSVKGNFTLSRSVPQTDIDEAMYQGGNLMGSLLMKQSAASGSAPSGS
jgi:hypothetical protein